MVNSEPSLAILLEQTRLCAADLPALPAFDAVLDGERPALFEALGYSFWNRELLNALADHLRGLHGAAGPAWWLELGAGTGRLAAELSRRGIRALATDDFSQTPERVRGSQRPIRYGKWVLRLPMREAVARFRPQSVLLAWPPLGSGAGPELLCDAWPGSEALRHLLCIGEPGGATEAPVDPDLTPPGWTMTHLPDIDRWLVGFTDPPGEQGAACGLLFRRATPFPHAGTREM